MADGSRAAEPMIALWPKGPPGGVADIPPESTFRAPGGAGPDTTMLRNVSEPMLTVYPADPARAHGGAVIVCPGGGWRILAYEHEGRDMARWLAARGWTAFLLKYRLIGTPADPEHFAAVMARMNGSAYEILTDARAPRRLAELMTDDATPRGIARAAEDGRRALALVRERAGDWGVDPSRVGMMGFSAGAFLTVDVALDPGGAPLAFAGAIYGGETGGRAVPADAPPLFALIAQDDRMLVKVVEGLHADWSAADRPSELHVFARGGHGFGLADVGRPVDRWPELFGAWLEAVRAGWG